MSKIKQNLLTRVERERRIVYDSYEEAALFHILMVQEHLFEEFEGRDVNGLLTDLDLIHDKIYEMTSNLSKIKRQTNIKTKIKLRSGEVVVVDRNNRIELLNSEGPYLLLYKTGHPEFPFIITSDSKNGSQLSREDTFKFTRGQISWVDHKDVCYNYMTKPGSEKPDLRELDIFIGVDVNRFKY